MQAYESDTISARFLADGTSDNVTHGGTAGDIMDFQGYLQNRTDSDLYINSFKVENSDTYFAGNGISFDNNGAWWKTHFQYGNDTSATPYVPLAPSVSVKLDDQGNPVLDGLGKTIPTDQMWWGDLLAAHTTEGVTQTGIYSGIFNIYGGASFDSDDLLATLNFSIDVVSDYSFTNELVYPDQSAFPGQTVDYQSKYTNNGEQTIRFGALMVTWSPDLTNLDMFWGTIPDHIAQGESVVADVFSLKVGSGAVPHQRNTALIGGYYAGDSHVFTS